VRQYRAQRERCRVSHLEHSDISADDVTLLELNNVTDDNVADRDAGDLASADHSRRRRAAEVPNGLH
jgi:hypothetical protein